MKTFSALLALCTGNSPVFDVFFDLRLNMRLNKQSRRRWFETPSRSSWRHCNGIYDYHSTLEFEESHTKIKWSHLHYISKICKIFMICQSLISPYSIHMVGLPILFTTFSLQWRHNVRDSISNHRRLDCLPSRLFRRRSYHWLKKFTRFIIGLEDGLSPARRQALSETILIYC